MFNPFRRFYERAFDDGYDAALLSMKDAYVQFDPRFNSLIDKPATIKVWKDRHQNNWKNFDTLLLGSQKLSEIKFNVDEHKAYLEIFPELEDGVNQ